MVWKIEFDPAAIKELRKLDPPTARRIISFLRERIAILDDPCSIGQALSGGKLGDFWKYRVGDWRIITNIEDKRLLILVLRVGNRREIYK